MVQLPDDGIGKSWPLLLQVASSTFLQIMEVQYGMISCLFLVQQYWMSSRHSDTWEHTMHWSHSKFMRMMLAGENASPTLTGAVCP